MKLLNSKTRRTLDAIFRHPTTHNLEWGDIRKLFEEIGETEQEHNGNLKVTLSGKTIVFQSLQDTKVATEDEIQEIRKFMRGADIQGSKPPHLLLVIDHQSAELYHTEFAGSVPERILPFDPDGHKSHVHSKHEFQRHGDVEDNHLYFEAVAKTLEGDDPLLLFGSGQGSSSTMDSFATWLKERHPKVAERIVKTVLIDESHLSEGELLAKARDAFDG